MTTSTEHKMKPEKSISSSADVRKAFLEYFVSKGHTQMPSSSLIPGNDATLLFTNAGMVQFKDVFLGIEERPYVRATSSQRCVRAGGKHNDLENVGYTARHHTFFEMLGNFSFGDYFKHDAICFAWEFLTQVLGLPAEKLWVTVFKEDPETEAIWLNDLKIDPSRFSRCGEKDNFWSMGDTGPCGPCTEIFYDHGPDIPGGPPGSPDEDGDRYVEIWNLVFMQFDRSSDGTLKALPKPAVDTGMGLERISAVVQGVHSNYEIDLFQKIITAAAKIVGITDLNHSSLKVIADHIRSCSFLIVDGVIPSNEGRGYVLRRITRRAIRHGHKLGMMQPFFHQLVATLVAVMGDAYPELHKMQHQIEKILLKEEEQFAKTLDLGMKMLQQTIAALTTDIISGDVVFKLYDTFGFPADLTADVAREHHLKIDDTAFEACMAKQRAQSQQASHFDVDYTDILNVDKRSVFTGYEEYQHAAVVTAIVKDSVLVDAVSVGERASIILDRTPFYAESGGQVGDVGLLSSQQMTFRVEDTQRVGDAILHNGSVIEGSVRVGDNLLATIDYLRRQAIRLNHTATHLLHAALREVLGEHVKQQGSIVTPEKLRFDFSHFQALTRDEIEAVEQLVNTQIRLNHSVDTQIKTPEQAQAEGAMALFGEKYGEQVRVLSMGNFSKELCGGTHAERTGDIGFFKLTSEAGTAAGIRRIEAVTGEAAYEYVRELESQLTIIAQTLKGSTKDALARVEQLVDVNKQLEKNFAQLKQQLSVSLGDDLASQAELVSGVRVLVIKLNDVDVKSLRDTLDQLKNTLGSSVIVLAAVNNTSLNVIAGLSKDCIGRVPAPRDLVARLCGKGGGRDDMAQGGGIVTLELDAHLDAVREMIRSALSA